MTGSAAIERSIGVWRFFPSLDNYVEGLREMGDVVGVDYVSVGTDQYVTRRPCAMTANGLSHRGYAARRFHLRGDRKDRRRRL
jgi:hypothetical protein